MVPFYSHAKEKISRKTEIAKSGIIPTIYPFDWDGWWFSCLSRKEKSRWKTER